jgi:hypothetical protein
MDMAGHDNNQDPDASNMGVGGDDDTGASSMGVGTEKTTTLEELGQQQQRPRR